jgi:hypothetical protein
MDKIRPEDVDEIESLFKAGLDPTMRILRREVEIVGAMKLEDEPYTTDRFGFMIKGLGTEMIDVEAWKRYAVEFVGRCIPGANVVYPTVTIEDKVGAGLNIVYASITHCVEL